MSVPFAGKLFTFPEPDGAEVPLLGWGNQFEAVFETLDGYTVAIDPRPATTTTPTLSDDQTTLLPTGPRVGPVAAATSTATAPPRDPAPRSACAGGGGPRRTVPSSAAGSSGGASAGRPHAPPPPRAPSLLSRRSRPPSVTSRGLCLLIQFPDVPGTITQQEVDHFCNQAGYTGFGNNGSVHDYFLEVSDGKLRYRNVVTAYYTASQHNAVVLHRPGHPLRHAGRGS